MSTSAYREFTGKSVEEALRIAREDFGVGLDDLDFEILTPAAEASSAWARSRPHPCGAAVRARCAAPKREAAAQRPLPPPPPRKTVTRTAAGVRPRPRWLPDRGPRRDDRGGGFGDRGPRREGGGFDRDRGSFGDRGPRRDDRAERPAFRSDRGDHPTEERRDAPEGVPVMDVPQEGTGELAPARTPRPG